MKIWRIIIAFQVVLIVTPSISHAATPEEIRAQLAKLPEEGKSRAKARLHSELATQLYREGKMEVAAAEFEKALQFRTNKTQRRHIYLYMGKSYESHGRLDKAIYAYEQAVTYDSKNWRRHRDLGWAYENARLYPKARDSYQSALDLTTKEATIYEALGRIAREMNLYQKAEAFLLKAKNLEAKPHTDRELSYVYERQGRYAEALETFQKSMPKPASSGDWQRVIYLAFLGQNPAPAENGLRELQGRTTETETLKFYENIAGFMKAPPEQILSNQAASPYLRTLIDRHIRTDIY